MICWTAPRDAHFQCIIRHWTVTWSFINMYVCIHFYDINYRYWIVFKHQYCFSITFRRDSQRSYELRAKSESDCKAWIQAIKQARYAAIKNLHKLSILHPQTHLNPQWSKSPPVTADGLTITLVDQTVISHWIIMILHAKSWSSD